MSVRNMFGVVLVALLILGGSAAAQQPRPIQVMLIEPTSLPRGQTTAITVIAQGLPNIQSAFIYPPIRVKVVEIKGGAPRADGIVEVRILIAVDANATPGERALSVQLPGFGFELTKIRIQDHNIRIADLKPGFPDASIPADHGAPPRLFSFMLFDDQNDVFQPDGTLMGEIETRVRCGNKETQVRGRDLSSCGVSREPATPTRTAPVDVPTQVVRRARDADKAGMPPPPQIPATMPQGNITGLTHTVGTNVTFDLPEWAGKGPCEVRVSVKDKAGNESNPLRLAIDLK